MCGASNPKPSPSPRPYKPSSSTLTLTLTLQDTGWAPQLLCHGKGVEGHSEGGVVFEAVGKPVSPHNLPRDWRAQTATILTDLHSRGIRHNDIWRPGRLDKNSLVPWMFEKP